MLCELIALLLGAQSVFPTQAPTAEELVPAHCRIIKKVEGDLDRDRSADAALRLSCGPAGSDPAKLCSPDYSVEGCVDPGEHDQVLLVALKRGDRFERVAVSDRVLICSRCGGAVGQGPFEPAIDVSIEKGVVVVSQLSGAREVRSTIHRFQWDAKGARFLLVGLDDEQYDRVAGTGELISTNYLTGKQIVEKSREIPKCEDPRPRKCIKYSKVRKRVSVRPVDFDEVEIQEQRRDTARPDRQRQRPIDAT